jgi:hypothetical protein
MCVTQGNEVQESCDSFAFNHIRSESMSVDISSQELVTAFTGFKKGYGECLAREIMSNVRTRMNLE